MRANRAGCACFGVDDAGLLEDRLKHRGEEILIKDDRGVPAATLDVVIVGIAGVVGVLVSVLAMAEGFRYTLASTGRDDRVIMLRAGLLVDQGSPQQLIARYGRETLGRLVRPAPVASAPSPMPALQW